MNKFFKIALGISFSLREFSHSLWTSSRGFIRNYKNKKDLLLSEEQQPNRLQNYAAGKGWKEGFEGQKLSTETVGLTYAGNNER